MRRALLLMTALALSVTGCSGDADPAPATATTTALGTAEATEPGTALDFGDQARLVWQPEAGLTGTLDLSVESVSQEPQSVFRGWVRDRTILDSRPYFVTVSITNTGESDLAGRTVPLYLRDETGALGAPWTLGGDFTACQSGPLPSPFAAGAEAEMCLVYLVPNRGRITDMVFEPTEGFDPISWTGDVEVSGRRTE